MSTSETIELRGHTHLVNDSLSPRQARADLRDEILAAVTDAGARPFVVRDHSPLVSRIGVVDADRRRVLDALASRLRGPATYVEEVYPDVVPQPFDRLTAERLDAVPTRCPAVRVIRLRSTPDRTLVYARECGTTVEFWSGDPDAKDYVRAPLPNVAAQVAHRDELESRQIIVEGRTLPSIRLFDRKFLDDVGFPIDAVYTWVDGGDPKWQERFGRARSTALGLEYHAEAQGEQRYQSRDELLFSLRSLACHAPWIRHVYLVTDNQVPGWLNRDCPRLTLLDHRDIFDDPSVLPVFNSSAIISQLHHIEGLSENYLYINDDVFFGRDVTPSEFWFGSGIAKVFPSRQHRPFGPAVPGQAPHFNISTNIRSLLEGSVGTSISLAIRHTTLPQIRSVNYELEQRFGPQLARTAGRQFRHHEDVALDQLFHYYAQATGHAVASQIAYDYVNVGVDTALPRLRRLLAARDRSVFCLNDAPEPGDVPMPAREVARFLRSYFPFKSEFER